MKQHIHSHILKLTAQRCLWKNNEETNEMVIWPSPCGTLRCMALTLGIHNKCPEFFR